MAEGDALSAARRMWDHPGHQVFSFGALTSHEVERIRRATGVNLSGFSRFMATRGVRHVKNNHSNEVQEAAREQLAVKPSDFARIPQIAATGSVRLIGQPGARKPARLEYRTDVDDRVYVYLEIIGAAEKRLELWGLRIEKIDKRKS